MGALTGIGSNRECRDRRQGFIHNFYTIIEVLKLALVAGVPVKGGKSVEDVDIFASKEFFEIDGFINGHHGVHRLNIVHDNKAILPTLGDANGC